MSSLELGKLASGHTVEFVDEEDERKMKKDLFAFSDGAIRLQPGGWVLPKSFLHFASDIYDFQFRPTDVCIVTFPKSGTTWLQEIVWNMINNPDLDNPAAGATIDIRAPNVEADMFLAIPGAPEVDPEGEAMSLFKMMCPGMNPDQGLSIQLINASPEPRVLKIHLPLTLLPPNMLSDCKVISIMRDPRDVILSCYHYARLQILWDFKGSLDDFVDHFVNDRFPFAPYWNHIKLCWENRHLDTFHLLFYEDLLANPEGEIRKIDAFLGTKRTDQQIKNMVDYTSFSALKERTKSNPPSSNDFQYYNKDVLDEGGFFRKGISGGWKESFTRDQIAKINAWMTKNVGHFGDNFKYKV